MISPAPRAISVTAVRTCSSCIGDCAYCGHDSCRHQPNPPTGGDLEIENRASRIENLGASDRADGLRCQMTDARWLISRFRRELSKPELYAAPRDSMLAP